MVSIKNFFPHPSLSSTLPYCFNISGYIKLFRSSWAFLTTSGAEFVSGPNCTTASTIPKPRVAWSEISSPIPRISPQRIRNWRICHLGQSSVLSGHDFSFSLLTKFMEHTLTFIKRRTWMYLRRLLRLQVLLFPRFGIPFASQFPISFCQWSSLSPPTVTCTSRWWSQESWASIWFHCAGEQLILHTFVCSLCLHRLPQSKSVVIIAMDTLRFPQQIIICRDIQRSPSIPTASLSSSTILWRASSPTNTLCLLGTSPRPRFKLIPPMHWQESIDTKVQFALN